ncbi:MAG: DNA translocase FtsK 4TM domain-containing protein [Acidobacteriota bacterium]
MSVHPKKKAREMGGLVYLVTSFLLYLALFSYRSLDPSLNVSTPWQKVQNLAGPAGAWISDLLFQTLGLSAIILPLPLLIVGSKKLLGRRIEYPWLKTLGFVGVILSLSCGLTLLEPSLPEWLEFRAGGVLGILGSGIVVSWFNRSGGIVVILAILLLSLMLTTRFSIEGLLNWLGARRPLVRLSVRDRWRRWRKRRSDRRALKKIKQDDQQLVARSMPRDVAFGDSSQPRSAQSGRPRSPLAQDSAEAGRNDAFPTPVLRTPPPTQGTPAAADDRGSRVLTEKSYQFPALDFLQDPPDSLEYDEKELVERAHKLTTKCAEFGVLGQVHQIQPGPVVTTFEFKPDPGVKYSRITNLSDDLCLALRAASIRIDRIPGKNTVGIEVPNTKRRIIYLKEILASGEFQRAQSPLTLALGQLINGATTVVDLDRMPHLLIAGSTGSGKSVGLNCMVCSILFKAGPNEVRFILVDPKRLELGLYEDIPHLLTPIVTDPKQAANALNWAVREMEDRYKVLAQQGVRNIAQYNALVRQTAAERGGEQDEEELNPLPNIVIIVDELADLMMTAGKDVETAVTRLAQMARAVGIHLILATQRPSVDVITGLIKANFPSRLSFRVTSRIDSRTILDSNGAEQLLGMGDMLFLSPETSRLVRIHGAYISEKEIGRVVKFLREQGEPDYQEEILIGEEDDSDSALVDIGDLEDALYQEAASFVVDTRKASTSLLQRRFRIGYGRAARLLDMMEHEGLVGPSEGSKAREVLVPPGYFHELDDRN